MKQLRPLTVYGFTIFSNAAISFLTFSLLTHHLTEVDYGIINLYNSYIVLLMPFISIGVPFVLNVDYFKLHHEKYNIQFTNALVIPLVSCLLFVVLSFIFHSLIERITKVNLFFALLAPFICLLYVLNDVMLNLFRNKERYFLYSGYSLLKNITEVSFTILLVIVLGMTWEGRLSSNLIALSAGALIIFIFIYKWKLFTGVFKKSWILSILVSGLPFIPERLAIFTLGYSDRFFIDHYSSTADVGYYGAGAQVAMIVNLSILTLNNTFYPDLFKSLAEQPVNYRKLRRVIALFIGFSALITLSVISSIPLFFKFFIGPNFQPGRVYAVYLAIGLFFWSIYNVFVAFLLSLRKNKLIMRISIFGMILSLAANSWNVRHYGALGATYSSMFVYACMAIMTLWHVNKHYRLKDIFQQGK